MSGSHCEACPVPAGLPCYNDPVMCRRAARPGEDAFRETLVKHAEGRAASSQAPGLLQKAANFAVATLKHVAAGRPQASPERKAARLAICQACNLYEAEKDRCQVCGCGLSIKAGWADQSCPLDSPKWGPITSD